MPLPDRRPSPFDTDPRLRYVARVSRLLDSQFRLPGTDIRFGLDPILGFIPVLGDLGTTAVSVSLLLTMLKHGASGRVVVRMALNILLDSIIGAIPVLGNIFDFAYKSNERNVELLRQHYAEGRHHGSGRGLVALLLLGFMVLLGLVAWGSALALRAAWQWLEA